MNLTLELTDTVTGTLASVMSRLDRATELHDAIGTAVEDSVSRHVTSKKQSPNTKWWARAARSLSHTASATETSVAFSQRGVALRYYGGTVRQKEGGPLLTIPTDKVPVRDGTRLAAREMGPLFFLQARRPARKGVVGVLVEAESYTITRGPRKGSAGKRRKPGGSLLYTLMSETTHKPDPTVLPTEAELRQTAIDAADDYLFTQE